MKVAIISRGTLPINQKSIRGTESWIYNFVNALVDKGMEVTLFASGDSKTKAKLKYIYPKPFFYDSQIKNGSHRIFRTALISYAFTKANQFDIYHDNTNNGEFTLPFAPFINKPLIITLHGNISLPYYKSFFSLFKKYSHVYFVSISHYQQTIIPWLNYIKTIYHGININFFEFSEKGGKSMFWAGRGSKEKGLIEAIKVSSLVNKLLFLAIIKEKDLNKLFKKEIKLKKNFKLIKYNFNISKIKLIKYYQNAKLFLFPIQWEEPFGLVMIESMACGTPVVAFARGSVPEVIKDGETGFIVNPSDDDIRGNWIIKKTGIEGLCEAVEKIYSMPEEKYRQMRRACRAHVEKHFTVERMVDEYEKVYEEILSRKT